MVIIGGVKDRAYVDHDGVDLIDAVVAVPFLQRRFVKGSPASKAGGELT